MNSPALEALNHDVSEAIRVAESFANGTSAQAKAAFRKVSQLENAIAKIMPASDPQGRIARRGAVRAAMNAGDRLTALSLAATYVRNGIDHELQSEILAILRQE